MTDVSHIVADALSAASRRLKLSDALQPRGVVRSVADGVAIIAGLDDVGYEELLVFDSGALGIAFDLRKHDLGAVLLTGADRIGEGEGVVGLQKLPELPVGPEALGRILNPLGLPLDERPRLSTTKTQPLFKSAPEIIERQSVKKTFRTGVTAVDAAIPIGRGQRELIIGDRNVGKTALATDFLAAQQQGDVACVYVMIGQPMSRVQVLHDLLEQSGCLNNTAIIAAYASDSPGLQYLAPFAGATMAESFREAGGDAVVIYDDLTKHADAYRELALLLGRPPGRAAYPGDIFYLHAELLERAAPLGEKQGGGSVTAFPLVETTEGDISAYIPTNLISITDGQIYLDTNRFERDLRPAIDIGRSVSRIGATAQSGAMRKASRNLKIQISRFESVEKLSRVGLDVDLSTQTMLKEGNILRQLLRQKRFSPRTSSYQVILLTAVSEHWISDISASRALQAIDKLHATVERQLPEIVKTLDRGELPPEGWQTEIRELVPGVLQQISG
ncbi:MAG: F0F1 ATP synthase subunit alpha [Planctomyces sp.]|nr:F0F1 ATP synthase subunit alpha [Planctomyces sp.]